MTELLTPEQVQLALKLGRTRTYALLGNGELPVVRIGRSVRVDARDLAAWIEAHREPAAAR